MKRLPFLLVIIAMIFSANSYSQSELQKREVRGTWIATVINLDWPPSPSWTVSQKKSNLKDKLQSIKEQGINTVYFQVRTEGDALYDSEYEPWSKYLTGEEGTAPDPYWDPLQFAIEETHKLGMELHAWLNPYRAMRTIPDDFTQKTIPAEDEDVDPSLLPFLQKEYSADFKEKLTGTTERDSLHVSNKHPEWLLVSNNKIAIFDPGLPEVMDYNLMIVMDIVNRYDVDGIHFDDYFYPYPPNHMASSSLNNQLDDSTFIKYPRGFVDKNNWRRNNINIFVNMVYDSIQTVKPWVKFGISPFGIWRPSNPPGIVGLDAYNDIYADALAWLDSASVDYLVPQLYWAFGGGQDFAKLSDWWADQVSTRDRHLYAGHGLYRSDASTFSGSLFSAGEVPRQVQYTRDNQDISGSIFFRLKNLTNHSSKGFKDSLITNYYRKPALIPRMGWKDTVASASPTNLVFSIDSEQSNKIHLSWDRPEDDIAAKTITEQGDTLLRYAVYRVDAASTPNELEEIENPENLIAITGETSYTDIAEPSSTDNYYYFVTALDRNHNESEPTEPVNAGVIVSNEDDPLVISDYRLSQNYPNPFNPSTTISFSLGEAGFTTLKVYDLLGREVRTLIEENRVSGGHEVSFNAGNLSSGIYFYELKSNGVRLIRKMTLLK